MAQRAYIPEAGPQHRVDATSASANRSPGAPEERYGSALIDRIGNTPLIRLDTVVRSYPGSPCWRKLNG